MSTRARHATTPQDVTTRVGAPRSRKALAVAGVAFVGVLGVGCSDDDGDGNPEIEAPDVSMPDVSSPDLDPGEGDGLPGDRSDEAPGDTGATDDLPDVDVDVDNNDGG